MQSRISEWFYLSKIIFYFVNKFLQIIGKQAEKIEEMATVMRTAAIIDEENEMKYAETLGRLKEENSGLREILNMVNKYGSPKSETSVESKTVQTDDL